MGRLDSSDLERVVSSRRHEVWMAKAKAERRPLCETCGEALSVKDITEGRTVCTFCRRMDVDLAGRQREQERWAREHLSDDYPYE